MSFIFTKNHVYSSLKKWLDVRRDTKSKKLRDLAYKSYLSSGLFSEQIPYDEQKFFFIDRILENPDIMNLFRYNQDLPVRYGIRFDERVVEYPWVISRLSKNSSTPSLLDAGSTFNHPSILSNSIISKYKVYIVTLSPENMCFWDRGISYIFGDLRSLPIRDNYYDYIVCISTLEHVGMDNQRYGGKSEKISESNIDPTIYVIKEFQRLIKKTGRILITVPFGKSDSMGWARQFDVSMLKSIKDNLDLSWTVNTTIYEYDRSFGWHLSSEEKAQKCEFIHPPTHVGENYNCSHHIAPMATGIACLDISSI